MTAAFFKLLRPFLQYFRAVKKSDLQLLTVISQILTEFTDDIGSVKTHGAAFYVMHVNGSRFKRI